MAQLTTIRAALLKDLEDILAIQGPRKEKEYGSDYGIDRVSVCDNFFKKGDLTFYAHAKGGQKVIELYLSPWTARVDCVEAAIMITHGVDVGTIRYGDKGSTIGNKWFFAAVIRVTFPILANEFAELFARPTADDPDRKNYLTNLYKGIGFKDLEPGKLLFELDNADSQNRARQATEKWLLDDKR